ncbi:hypothetical protein T484DRAFT_1756918, partial [Baffinella frigidus]
MHSAPRATWSGALAASRSGALATSPSWCKELRSCPGFTLSTFFVRRLATWNTGSTGEGEQVGDTPGDEGKSHRPREPERVSPGQLTKMLSQCTDVPRLAGIVEKHLADLNFIHVAAAWGSLAKMPRRGGDGGEVGRLVVRDLRAATSKLAGQMGSKEVANVLLAMSKIHADGRGNADAALVAQLVARAKAKAPGFEPQHVANLLWALTKIGKLGEAHADADLLEKMARRAEETVDAFEPQQTARLLLSLAALRARPAPSLLEALERRATATAVHFRPQDMRDVVSSLAALQGGAPAGGGLSAAVSSRTDADIERLKFCSSEAALLAL